MLRMDETDPGSNDRVDVRLLAEIAAGVEQSFVELYRRRHSDVYRFAFAMAKSIATSSPSVRPFASATEALLVAIALAPPRAMACALPASHALNRMSGSPGT